MAGEREEAGRHAAEARRVGETLEDQEDREMLLADLDTLPGSPAREPETRPAVLAPAVSPMRR